MAIFAQPLRSMAENMAVGNSVGLRRLFNFPIHKFAIFVIISQLSGSVEYGKSPILIAMDNDPCLYVVATIFVGRDL